MLCSKCGQDNPEGAAICSGCGTALQQPQPQPLPYGSMQQPANIPNHLVFAILSTIFCCLPFGIVAIVYAAQVNGHISSGNVQAAQAASNSAKTWCWVSVGCWLAVMAVYAVLFFVGALSSMTSSGY